MILILSWLIGTDQFLLSESEKNTYEWIALRDPGCNGPCKSFYIQVYENGHASYHKLDQMHPIKYKTKVSKEEITKLWNYAKEANLENRKRSYKMEAEDLVTKTITWKRDGIEGKIEFKEYETEEIKILTSKFQSLVEYSKWKATKK